jgi:3-hydroxyisobutyrate dehydrogenase-like beta-hydroxyacid dehydrogenase
MKVGFIGIGRMGQVMATRLLAAGYEVVVFNRTVAKLDSLIALGGHPVRTIAELAAQSDVVLTMLANDEALQAVAAGPGGLINSLAPGGIHVAMGTHDVKVVRTLAAAHANARQFMLSAPVLGRPDSVAAGRLAVIVAGNAGAVTRCLRIFEALGRKVFAAGADPGSAAAMKLANNALLACAIEAIGEAFSLVEKMGVDTQVFHDLITDGLFSSPAYNTYARLIADKSWDRVGFTVELALKDINLALAAGNLAGVPLPSANVCRDRLLGAMAHGDDQRDWAAMALEQARASGLVR